MQIRIQQIALTESGFREPGAETLASQHALLVSGTDTIWTRNPCFWF